MARFPLFSLFVFGCSGTSEVSDTPSDNVDTAMPVSDAGETDAVDTPDLVGTCNSTHTTTTSVFNTADAMVYYDLDAAAVTDENDAGWDFRVSTWVIETNGGVTGSGGVELVSIPGAYESFDERCQAPSLGFAADESAGEGFSTWYNYNMSTHIVTPNDRMFYIRTTDGAYHRLRIDGYYEDGDTVHTPGFTHGAIDAP
jgi:hypothetical protein